MMYDGFVTGPGEGRERVNGRVSGWPESKLESIFAKIERK